MRSLFFGSNDCLVSATIVCVQFISDCARSAFFWTQSRVIDEFAYYKIYAFLIRWTNNVNRIDQAIYSSHHIMHSCSDSEPTYPFRTSMIKYAAPSHSRTANNKFSWILLFTLFEYLIFSFYRNAIYKVAEILMVSFIGSRLTQCLRVHANAPCWTIAMPFRGVTFRFLILFYSVRLT